MHFAFEKAQVGYVVAVFDTLLPFIAGRILMVFPGGSTVPHGVSVGTALAPTSVGIALHLLGETGVLQTDFS